MFDKAALKRDIDKDHKRKARERLAMLRERIRAARAAQRVAALEVTQQARALRLKLRDRIKAIRERARIKLREIATRERQALRERIKAMRAEARKNSTNAVDLAREELKAERHWQRELARLERNHKARVKAHPHASYLERRAESDDQVRANLPPDHLALWERIKGRIKPRKGISRTEAFFHYVEAHPHEHLEAIEHNALAEVRKLERKAWEEQRALAKESKKRKRSDLEAVPF